MRRAFEPFGIGPHRSAGHRDLMAYRQEESVAEIIQRSGVLGGRVPWYPGRDKETETTGSKEFA